MNVAYSADELTGYLTGAHIGLRDTMTSGKFSRSEARRPAACFDRTAQGQSVESRARRRSGSVGRQAGRRFQIH